jgi:predicted small lipoprotein YifL
MVQVFKVGHYNSQMKKKRASEILGVTPTARRTTARAALLVGGLLMVGCGQKGPLVLPAAAPAKASAADTSRAPATRTDSAPIAPR